MTTSSGCNHGSTGQPVWHTSIVRERAALRDYVEWHRDYDVPGSNLAKRLAVVQRRFAQALDAMADTDGKVLSLCAGDGRDVLNVLERQHNEPVPRTTLVEADDTLAGRAEERARDLGLAEVHVVCGDAGISATWAQCLPVDVLLLCGILGNISTEDVRRTLGAVPAIVRPGGYVVWTRCRSSEEDQRPKVREWCTELGLVEIAFDGEPETFGVGLSQRSPGALWSPLPEQLFTFLR